MTKEIEEAIHKEATQNAGLQYSRDAFTGCISSFKSGVIWALSHPELMREEMEKMIKWMEKPGKEKWLRWRAYVYQPSAIFNEYLEHLKQQP